MKKPTKKIRKWAEGILQPDWQRLADAHMIKRDPDTYEISWPVTDMMEQLKRDGLI